MQEAAICTFFFYLLGNLSKVADVSQDGAFDDRVLSILTASLGVEVRVERVHALHSSRTLLPVSKNKVDPQVDVGTHVFTFQGLTQKKAESCSMN